MHNPQLFSSYLPDFLKLDLGIGSERPHPLVEALDNIINGWETTLLARAHSLQPAHYSLEQRRSVLAHLGFNLEGLSDESISSLFDNLPVCLDQKGQMISIVRLAEIHFGKCEVYRGLPYAREKVTTQSFPLRVHDATASKTILFVRLERPADEKLVASFNKNAALILPPGYSARVAPPRTPVTRAETKIALTQPLPLKGRRL